MTQISAPSILSSDESPRWYVIQTYVGFEDAVKKVLTQKITNLSLDDKILEVYVPLQKVIKLNSKNERVEKEEKVYPGYIYIHMVMNKETAYLIQNTQYVSKITGTGDVALPLEPGYVDEIKRKLAEGAKETSVTKTKVELRVGDLIRVIDGPFKDMQGNISEISTVSDRISVLLTIFERETEVELDSLEVEKVIV
jgi:transcription termination/antitermination protein NusG